MLPPSGWTMVEAPRPQDLRPQTIPFLKLPYEIRRLIYKAALLTDELIIIDAFELYDWRLSFPGGLRLILNIGFLRACKTVHEEALPIFYGGNPFYFTGNTLSRDGLKCLISDRILMHIKRLRLALGFDLSVNTVLEPVGPMDQDRTSLGQIYSLTTPILDSDRLWAGICQLCTNVNHVYIDFYDNFSDFFGFVLLFARNLRHQFQSNLIPRLLIKAKICGEFMDQEVEDELQSWLQQKPDPQYRFPANVTIEVSATITSKVEDYLVQKCRGFGWTFRKGSVKPSPCTCVGWFHPSCPEVELIYTPNEGHNRQLLPNN